RRSSGGSRSRFVRSVEWREKALRSGGMDGQEAVMSESDVSKHSGVDGGAVGGEVLVDDVGSDRPLRAGAGNKLVGIQRVFREDARWTITQGDSLKLLRALPDAGVDAVITDPPYSSGSQFTATRACQPPSKKYGL